MNEGFIKLFRSLLDWEWYDDINVTRLFIHLLLKANFKDSLWRGIEVKRGENLTTLSLLSQETGLTVRELRTCINKLKKTNEITVKSTSSFSIIKLNNFDKYQTEDTQKDKQETSNRQSRDKRETYKEEEKERKEEKEIYSSAKNVFLLKKEFDDLGKYFGESIRSEYIEKLSLYLLKNPKKQYKSHYLTIRNWLNNAKILPKETKKVSVGF